jgi:hypothetical protein
MDATAQTDRELEGVQLGDLPPEYRGVAEYVGLGTALELVAWRGGSALLVPVRPGPEHALVRRLGAERAGSLVAAYGGSRIHVPTRRGVLQASRDRAIRAARAAGATVPDLLERYELSERRLYEILARTP